MMEKISGKGTWQQGIVRGPNGMSVWNGESEVCVWTAMQGEEESVVLQIKSDFD